MHMHASTTRRLVSSQIGRPVLVAVPASSMLVNTADLPHLHDETARTGVIGEDVGVGLKREDRVLPPEPA
jgi:hypothetical protein